MLHSIRLIIVDVAPSSSKIAVEMYEAIVDTRYGGWREDWCRTVSDLEELNKLKKNFSGTNTKTDPILPVFGLQARHSHGCDIVVVVDVIVVGGRQERERH